MLLQTLLIAIKMQQTQYQTFWDFEEFQNVKILYFVRMET